MSQGGGDVTGKGWPRREPGDCREAAKTARPSQEGDLLLATRPPLSGLQTQGSQVPGPRPSHPEPRARVEPSGEAQIGLAWAARQPGWCAARVTR